MSTTPTYSPHPESLTASGFRGMNDPTSTYRVDNMRATEFFYGHSFGRREATIRTEVVGPHSPLTQMADRWNERTKSFESVLYRRRSDGSWDAGTVETI